MESEASAMDRIPDCCLYEVFSYIPISSRVNIMLVCHRWNELASNPLMWRRVAKPRLISSQISSCALKMANWKFLSELYVPKAYDVHDIIRTVALRCAKLKVLDISDTTVISKDVMESLCQRCTLLNTLIMKNSYFPKSISYIIALRLVETKNLEFVDINGCSWITPKIFKLFSNCNICPFDLIPVNNDRYANIVKVMDGIHSNGFLKLLIHENSLPLLTALNEMRSVKCLFLKTCMSDQAADIREEVEIIFKALHMDQLEGAFLLDTTPSNKLLHHVLSAPFPPSLSFLSLSTAISMTDDTFNRIVSAIPHVEYLCLYNFSDVTSSSFARIYECVNLEMLLICGVSLQPNNFFGICSRLPKLWVLSISQAENFLKKDFEMLESSILPCILSYT
ncbi:uncharacterized protein LOC125179127 [Hyalella azteca]|uniref:Uncharacterized protein LOC125179127 n=1 Tax=Hyalella azteca TaxID=294128 RepID=A0A979FT03_HYAAZ|nr:uncharacterized protein LOC125179127 [Hyalella azteca]